MPYHKPDISIAADIVEEVLRIDGLDNIAIPSVITMSPAIDPLEKKEKVRLLLEVSESVAERVPIRLPIDDVSDMVLEVREISVGGLSIKAS